MKKKIALAVAIGFFISLMLWIVGYSDEFHRFNRFLIIFLADTVRALIP